MVWSADLRHAPRIDIALACTLRRPIGRPIGARTHNVGAGGMLISSDRPLAVDEPLDFDLASHDVAVSGQARVLRHHQLDLYALRFERPPAAMAGQIEALVSSV